MNYIIPIAFCVPAIIMSIFLLLDSNSTLVSGLVEIKKMRNIIFAGLLQAIVYAAEYVINGYGFFGLRQFAMPLEALLYICNLYFIFAYADLIFTKYEKKLYGKNVNRLLFLSPLIGIFVLELINIFYPVFFDITPVTLEYVEKPWVVIVNIIPILYIVFSGLNDVKEWRENTHYFSLPISLYFIITALGIVLESIFFDYPIIPACCAISNTMMYIRIVKRIGYIDLLSGLYTRSSLSIYISGQLSKLTANEMLVGVMLDVNHFKEINDTYGHVIGDRAISGMGEILRAVTRRQGVSFRYGGDEFIVIFKASDNGQIDEMMKRIESAVEEYNEKKAEVFELSVSKGYSVYGGEDASVVSFIDEMDAQMYKNKNELKRK